MIDILEYAQTLEAGLNNGMPSNLRFAVWSDAGKYQAGTRQGNDAVTIIPCLLRRASAPVTSTNNGLKIATENIVLEVAVPYKVPKTRNTDPAPDVADTDGVAGVYTMVESLRQYLDEYFSANTADTITVGGVTYACGMEHSLSETGEATIAPAIGQYVTFSVTITLNVVENGINSLDVKVSIDNETVPYLSASPSRSSVKQSDVYAGQGSESKTYNTSTAFALQISSPATESRVTNQFIDYLLYGKKDVVHFVRITMGGKTRLMYAVFGDVAASVEGVLNVGTTINVAPVADNPELLEYPDYFTIYRLSLPAPQAVTLSVSEGDFSLHFGRDYYGEDGAVYDSTGTEVNSITETPVMLYDYDNQTYYMYIAVCGDVTLTASAGTLTEM